MGTPSNASFRFGGESSREFTFIVSHADTPIPSPANAPKPSHADAPIPSVESEPDASTDAATPSSGFNPDMYLGTFSGVFNDPPRQRASSFSTHRDLTTDIAQQLDGLRLTNSQSLSMKDLATALNDVSGTSTSPTLKVKNPAYGRAGSAPADLPPQPSSKDAHRVEDEILSSDHFQNEKIQNALKRSRELMSQLERDLSGSSLVEEQDSTIRRLRHRVQELANFQCPATRTVGFVGDSGVGKSSLLNSLLDQENLARTSSSGVACTCVITEYHYHDATTFKIKIDTFSGQELKTQIRDLVAKYRTYHRDGDKLDEPEQELCKKHAQVAEDTLTAMFGSKLQDLTWLINETNVERVNERLITWATEYLASQNLGDQVLESAKKCSEQLHRLTSDKPSINGPALWPFIRGVKSGAGADYLPFTSVYLGSSILRKGLVLVDLPGLRDLNSARRVVTERYLAERKCDEIFAVCDISRATSDVAVMNVFELASRARLSSLGIVCTRTDNYIVEEASQDWPGEAHDTIEELIKTRDRCKVAKTEKYREFRELMSQTPDTHQEIQRIKEADKERDWAKNQLLEAEFNLQRFIIEKRNHDISVKLVGRYRSQVYTYDGTQTDLKVCCISNPLYWKKRDEVASKYLPYLNLSGILDMRQHFVSKVADSQVRLAQAYMQNHIPDVLRDLELWVEDGAGSLSTERRIAVQRTLGEVEEQLDAELLGLESEASRLAQDLDEHFREHVDRVTRIPAWCEAASNASKEWSTWAHRTTHYGHYTTASTGRRNWNEGAMKSMVNDLTGPVDDLIDFAASKEAMVVDIFLQATRAAEQKIKADLAEHHRATVFPLINALRSRQRQLDMDMSDLFYTFDRDLLILRTDALSSIRTSQFGKEVEEAYRKCGFESGPGSDRKRKDIIEAKMGSRTVFKSIMRFLRQSLDQFSERFEKQVKELIMEHLGVISDTFDIVRGENVLEESERNPEFRQSVKDSVASAVAEMNRIGETVGN